MAEELLQGADVMSALQQVCGERVAEGMTLSRNALCDGHVRIRRTGGFRRGLEDAM